MDVPNASLKSFFPFPLKYFFTFPGPDRCAAAIMPDSVISIPLIYDPTNHLRSFLKIHLFWDTANIPAPHRLHKSTNMQDSPAYY